MVELLFGLCEASIRYRPRAAVYGICLDEKSRIAMVRTEKGLFLPGGGKKDHESDKECIKREFREELGWEITIDRKIASYTEFLNFTSKKTGYKIHASVYRCKDFNQVQKSSEPDHNLEWITGTCPKNQIVSLGQRWIVESTLHDLEK